MPEEELARSPYPYEVEVTSVPIGTSTEGLLGILPSEC
jgi:hypothetical protein